MRLYPLISCDNIRFTENMERVPGRVHKTNRVMLEEGYTLTPSIPWEQRIDNGYPSVFYDEAFGEYRCYYFCFIRDDSCAETPLSARTGTVYGELPSRVAAVLLITSKDGVHWERPSLGCCEYDGSTDNNIVMTHVNGAGVFRDARETDPAKRYKMVMRGDRHHRMAVSFSADGIHWCEPIDWPEHNPAGDTHNFAFWDERIGRYLLITRTWGDGVRLVARCESGDFIHWSEPVEICRGDGRDDQLYSMPVFVWNGMYYGLGSFLHAGDRMSEDFDCVDCELLFSSDGLHWNRACRGRPFIERSAGKYGDHVPDCGCIYAASPILRDGKWEVYYFGSNGPHTGFRETSLLSAVIDPDALAGYTPPGGVGWLETAWVKLCGDDLYLKAEIGDGGRVRACVNTVFGAHRAYASPEGYGFEDSSLEAAGENLWRVRFAKPLSALADRRYSMVFEAENARLYGFGGDITKV
ncbi:MAG: hypothetical protein IJ493_13800 [Clostridia bacterium]|nr:hypothetical protein [Clostridia bacterium]